jgi:ubiquinone/menaquinone biosynthesis C-methylase UbiE
MTDYRKEEYWSKFANTYNEDQTYVVGEALVQRMLERLSRESDLGELIELGCGAGLYTKALAGNASRVIATDLSDEMLAVATKQLQSWQNVTVEKADCERTDYPDGKFGTVFMANLIHVIENPSLTLQESYRILKHGGLLLIVDYTGYGVKLFEKMKMGIRYFRRFGKPPRHSRNLSPDGLRALVESAGFEVDEVEFMGERIKAVYLKARKRLD